MIRKRRLAPPRLSGVIAAAVLASGCAAGGPAAAQSARAEASDSVPLYASLGSFHREISASDERVRAYFNQGLRLTYGFGHREGVRAFRAARELDPGCAMCWWGEAWALGPYINSPRMSPDAEREAQRAVSRASRLRADATPVERALIDAMGTRYSPGADPASRAGRDSAYAAAMREVVRAFPHDLDVATLAAEALMVLRPWDQWSPHGTPRPGTAEVLELLESVLARSPSHPGACHLYIHAVEASPDPGRAEACADRLGGTIPGASHLQHMPSHIYMRIGRYGDAVRSSQRARQVDLQAADGGPPGVYPSHNLHMLAFAASYDGQSAVALQAARDLARLAPRSAIYVDLTRVRFGRWQEILEDRERPEPPFHRAIRHFGLGLARLRTGDPSSAREELDALRALRGEVGESRFRRHREADLLGIAEGILAGELYAAGGRYGEAVAALSRAACLEDGLVYDEPEPWFLPPRHVLGAILIEAGRPREAEQVYREQLRTHPENGWALFGLALALRHQGAEAEAEATDRRFREAWKRADVHLRASRY